MRLNYETTKFRQNRMDLTKEYLKLGFYTVCDVEDLKIRHQRHVGLIIMRSELSKEMLEYFFKSKTTAQNCMDIFLILYCLERREINVCFGL